MNLEECLCSLGFSSTDGPENSARIEELEEEIGVRLPADFRRFLSEFGGGYLDDAFAPCTEPTPFGDHVVNVLHSIREISGLADSEVTPRNMICIGYGNFGATTCLSIAGLDHGQVFSLDTEMRFYWDETIISRFPHLDSSIREFFRMRDAGELPNRPWGYENCYHIANSFTEFLEKLRIGDE